MKTIRNLNHMFYFFFFNFREGIAIIIVCIKCYKEHTFYSLDDFGIYLLVIIVIVSTSPEHLWSC